MKKIDILKWNIKELFILQNYKRDKRIILFGAWFGTRFADNSRFLFQYLTDNKNNLGLTHVIWVTRSQRIFDEMKGQGYEVYMMDSQESIYFHRHAGVHIVCNGINDDLHTPQADLLGRYSTGALKINLWHAICGLKGIVFTSNEYLEFKKNHPIKALLKENIHKRYLLRKLIACYGGWGDCYFLSTSPYVTELMRKFTLMPEKNFIQSGFPRNYVDGRLLPEEEHLLSYIQKYKYRILYLPTFRKSLEAFIPPLRSTELTNWLHDHDVLWIEKAHSADQNSMLTTKEKILNVIQLDNKFEINTLMKSIDLLITDYSSVMYEAIFQNKPVLYYVPDLFYYQEQDRGLMQSPDNYMVGNKVFTVKELIEKLDTALENPKLMYGNNYYDVKKKVWGEDKGMEQIWLDICHTCGL